MNLVTTNSLSTLEGKPLKDEEGKEITVRSTLCNALLASFPDEQNTSGPEKLKRWKLAQAIYVQDEIELKAEEIVLLKSLVAKAFAPIVCGQLLEILDK